MSNNCKHEFRFCTEDKQMCWKCHKQRNSSVSINDYERLKADCKRKIDVLESALQKILWQGADPDENYEMVLMHDSGQMADIAREGLDCMFPNTRKK